MTLGSFWRDTTQSFVSLHPIFFNTTFSTPSYLFISISGTSQMQAQPCQLFIGESFNCTQDRKSQHQKAGVTFSKDWLQMDVWTICQSWHNKNIEMNLQYYFLQQLVFIGCWKKHNWQLNPMNRYTIYVDKLSWVVYLNQRQSKTVVPNPFWIVVPFGNLMKAMNPLFWKLHLNTHTIIVCQVHWSPKSHVWTP